MAEPCDRVIVIGAGVAGVAAALALAPLEVLLVAPSGDRAHTATALAQGGIAAAIGADDSPALHAADTQAAGAGLCEAQAVRRITQAAPALIARLTTLGVRFDTQADGALALGLEAAHGRARIVHAEGDATGRVVLDGLINAARLCPSIIRRTDLTASRLVVEEGRVRGVWCGSDRSTPHRLDGRAVVLATGGIGGLYGATTNPRTARGSGLAMAARAGAVLRDMEFVQFHPTAIASTHDPLPLASEALRGAGAILVDDTGERFMARVPGQELAPRDVVARAIQAHIWAGRQVFLDARPALAGRFAAHFPSVHALCRAQGLDPDREPIPVQPAAHYHMGGLKVDEAGRTSLAGLYACGEVASTGLHGANRLASNSLLEALAYGQWIGEAIRAEAAPAGAPRPQEPPAWRPATATPEPLRRTMDRCVGLVRDAAGLTTALARLAPFIGTDDAALVAALIALAALERAESRGGHFRADYPEPGPTARHTEITLETALPRLMIHAGPPLKDAV